MKPLTRHLCAAALAWTSILGLGAQTRDPHNLSILAEEGVRPYSYIEGNRIRGTDCDILYEAARRMKISVTITFAPWKRMQVELEKGGCDAAMTLFYLKERELYGVYVYPPIHFSTYVVFVRKGEEFPFTTIKDLKEKKVGVVRGYHISDAFDRAIKEGLFTVEESNSNRQNIRKLAAGRLDCIVSNLDYSLMEIKSEGLNETLVYLPSPVQAAKGAHLVLSKAGTNIADKKAFAERLGEVIKEIQQDGTYQRIMDGYLR